MKSYIQTITFSVIAAALLSACGANGDPPTQPDDGEGISAAVYEAADEISTGNADARKEQLREKAKVDPEAADAEAIGQMSGKEVVATAINSAGYLCAHVTEMYPSNGAILVYCTEYRNGNGRVKYRVDAEAGTVEPL